MNVYLVAIYSKLKFFVDNSQNLHFKKAISACTMNDPTRSLTVLGLKKNKQEGKKKGFKQYYECTSALFTITTLRSPAILPNWVSHPPSKFLKCLACKKNRHDWHLALSRLYTNQVLTLPVHNTSATDPKTPTEKRHLLKKEEESRKKEKGGHMEGYRGVIIAEGRIFSTFLQLDAFLL